MKKKKIVGLTVAVVVLLAIIGVGIWALLSRQNVETGGNRLGVAWYDVNETEFTITTADELYELAELSKYYDFKEQTIYLGADIVVNEGNAADWKEDAPKRKWTTITGFGGTFDGQGHTISGLYAKGYNTAIAMFTNSMTSADIKNFNLTNTYFESRGFGGVASIASNGGGHFTQIHSDALLNVVGVYSGFAGGICSKLNLQSTIENCWYDGVINTTGRDTGGILDDVYGCRVTISHCLFSGEINSTWDYSGSRIGGIVGRVYKSGATLILEDSLSTGKIVTGNTAYTGSILGVSMSDTALTTTDTYGSMNSYGLAIGTSGSKGNINSAPLELRENELIGTKAYSWTNLDFENYWTIVEDDTPILQCFAEEILSVEGLTKAFDTSWYSEGATEYVIEDMADLYGIYYLSASNTFSRKTIKVAADITVNEGKAKDWGKTIPELYWYPIKKFSGTFDGQGHTISGLYLKMEAIEVGMFTKTTMESTIKNFQLENSYFENTLTVNTFMGSIVGRGGGTIDTVYSDAIVVAYGPQCGGILGQMNLEAKSVITNCWYDGTFMMKESTGRYGGGIVGTVVKGITEITHCLNTGSISSEKEDGGANIGGICGATMNADTVLNIEDCFNAGVITTQNKYATGAIIGNIVKGTANVSNTYATSESCVPDGTAKAIGNVYGILNGGATDLPTELVSGYGAYQWTTLNFSDYWASVVSPNGTPILKSFANKVPSLSGVARLVDTSWYRADKTEFVLKDMADLYGFYIVSKFETFKDKTVKLGADITVNTGNAADWEKSAPTYSWYSINKFAGTFDGQGHTISGLYVKTDGTTIGLFSKTTLTSTIKNLKLANSYFESIATGNTFVGSVVGRGGGTIDTVYSDAIVVSTGEQCGGIIGQVNLVGDNKITNCWFDGTLHLKDDTGRYGGGIAGTVVLGSTTIGHCLNTGDIISEKTNGGANVGGICGAISNKNTKLIIEDCLNVGTISTQNIYATGSILGNVRAGEATITSTYATSESCAPSGSPKGVGNVYGTMNGTVVDFLETELTGYGSYKRTYLDFQTYWAVVLNDTPILQSFATNIPSVAGIKKTVDTSWYSEDATEYILYDMADLYGFYVISQSTNFAGKTVKLGANIVVNKADIMADAAKWETATPEYSWTPIGRTKAFAGTFDGQGYTISGIYMKRTDNFVGFFGYTSKDCVIKNFRLENSYIESTTHEYPQTGSIAGRGNGTFSSIYSNAIVKCEGKYCGGLIGRVDKGATITDCWFAGKVSTNGQVTGGLLGCSEDSDVTITHCLNSGEISSSLDRDNYYNMGGLVGFVPKGTTLTLSDSMNTGNVITVTNGGVGSAIGHVYGTLDIDNVFTLIESNTNIIGYDRGTTNGKVYGIPKIYAVGTNGYKYTTLDFYVDANDIGYWVARSNDAPALKTFVDDSLSVAGIDREWIESNTDWYTSKVYAGTEEDPYLIKTASDLYGLAELVNSGTNFYGEYIKLDATIEVNSDAPDTVDGWSKYTALYEWTPIGKYKSDYSTYFQGTFDGAGYSIIGLYASATSDRVGLFGATTADSTVKNVSVKNSYFKTTATQAGSISARGGGEFIEIYSNAVVVVEDKYCGGLLGMVDQATTVENCWFAGYACGPRECGGIAGYLTNEMSIHNSLVSGTVESTNTDVTAAYAGGFCGRLNGSNARLTTTNSMITGYVIASSTVTGGSYSYAELVGQMDANTYFSFDKVYVQTGSCANTRATGVKKSGSNYGTTSMKRKTEDQLKGQNAYLDSQIELDFWINSGDENEDNVWVARDGKTPALKSFVAEKDRLPLTPYIQADTRWYTEASADTNGKAAGDKDNPYIIKDADDLYGLATLMNAEEPHNFNKEYISLGANIMFNTNTPTNDPQLLSSWDGYEAQFVWTPIGTYASDNSTHFQGTLEGNGYSISGLYVVAGKNFAGLFGATASNATIQNLSIVNSYFGAQNTQAGSVSARGGGHFIGIYSNAVLVTEKKYSAGIIGYADQETEVENCWFNGYVSATQECGGIVGYLKSEMEVSNCLVSGTIESRYTGSDNANVGGICGITASGADLIAEKCLITGEIKVNNTATKGHGVLLGKLASGTTFTFPANYGRSGCCPATAAVGDKQGTYGSTTFLRLQSLTELTDTNALTYAPKLFEGTTPTWVAVTDSTPIPAVFAE